MLRVVVAARRAEAVADEAEGVQQRDGGPAETVQEDRVGERGGGYGFNCYEVVKGYMAWGGRREECIWWNAHRQMMNLFWE